MRESPEAILDKLIDVAVYVLDQAEARREQRDRGRVPPEIVPFDTAIPSAKDELLLFTAKEVAAQLGISETNVRRMATNGELRAVRFGRNLRFSRPSIQRWIEQHER